MIARSRRTAERKPLEAGIDVPVRRVSEPTAAGVICDGKDVRLGIELNIDPTS